MNRCVESAEEVASELAERPRADATAFMTDWLQRRDLLNAEMAADQLADSLETLAAELQNEAHHEATARTKGLLLAAGVLLDTARGVRIGDMLTAT